MRKLRNRNYVVLSLGFIGFCCSFALAQTTATISGTVKDETGAVLPGVAAEIKNIATGVIRSIVTDDEGRYSVPELMPGSYQVEASLTGFQTAIRTGINLTVGRHAIIDVVLKIGAMDEK